MKNRPSFLTYIKHRYNVCFGTSTARTVIVCKSGKEYTHINSAGFKVFRFLYIPSILLVFYLLLQLFGIQIGFAFLVASPLLYIGIALLRYCFTKFVEVDSDGRPIDLHDTQDNLLKLNKPPFRTYVKFWRRGRVSVDVKAHFMDKGQEYYIYPSKLLNFFGLLMTVLIFQILYRSQMFMSYAHNGVTVFVMILVLLFFAMLSFFFMEFHHKKYNNNIQDENDEMQKVKQSPLNYIIKGVILVLTLALVIGGFVINKRQCLTNKIDIDSRITYNEAYQIALIYTKEQCSDDVQLYRFSIDFDGNVAVQKRQPTSWHLYFEDPATGVFSHPNQNMYISKDIDSDHVSTSHTINVSKTLIYNAPTLPVDVGEILNILETELDISIDDMNATHIHIIGGHMSGCLERNTCIVSIENNEYMVDFENKTAHVHK